MTVAELMLMLRTFPKDLPVLIREDDGTFADIIKLAADRVDGEDAVTVFMG